MDQLHTVVSLLITSNVSYLFASGRIVCTLFDSHQGLLGFFKRIIIKKHTHAHTQRAGLGCVVREHKPPKGADLTGTSGGRSSDCLMKMNEENCWYRDHAGAPGPGC